MSLRTKILYFVAVMPLSWATPAYSQDHSSHVEHPQPTSTKQEANGGSAESRQSEAEHIGPDAPQRSMGQMSYREMADMMQMDDRTRFGKILMDQLEWRNTSAGSALVWEAQASYGGDYNKLFFKTEGERARTATEDASAELLWDRIYARWWSVQAGIRQDFGEGPSRTWAAIGVAGLAPYWFDVEATLYLGDASRTAARIKIDYDLLLTQRLILQPKIEANLYGKADPERQLGSGLSDLDAALRLRYEFRREFAPYVGVAWKRKFGGTADSVESAGLDSNDLQLIAGFRIWF